MAALLSPVDHPNGFAALSVGSVTSLIVVELHNRFGIDVSVEEATVAVAAFISLALFIGRKTGLDKPVDTPPAA